MDLRGEPGERQVVGEGGGRSVVGRDGVLGGRITLEVRDGERNVRNIGGVCGEA